MFKRLSDFYNRFYSKFQCQSRQYHELHAVYKDFALKNQFLDTSKLIIRQR